MLDRWLEVIIEFIEDILPFTVVPYYDKGVRLRFGKPRGGFGLWRPVNTACVMEHGFHWKWPFADKILTHMIKIKTMNLSEQSVTTKDNISVVAKAVIKYEVSDVEKLLLEVNDPVDALSDMTQGIIREKIINRNYSELNDAVLTSEISRAAKIEAKKWGISILDITLTDLAQMRSIRLLNTTNNTNGKD